jgi:hypothetical protein
MEKYLEFLKSKIEVAKETGFDIAASEIHPILKPHQRDAVQWAIKGGCRAIFESFGLGKSIQQLEIERIITRYSNKGELVYDPFGGIMSVPQKAVRMGRHGKGCELNADYFRDGVGYLKLAEEEANMPTLFDFMDVA